MNNMTQKYTAELLGTMVIVFVGSAAIVTTAGNVLISALAFGMAWAGMWWVFGNVSGGHFNPAITLANVVAKRTNAKDFIPYVVCQAIGGIIGSVLLWVVLNGAPASLAGTALATTLANPTTIGWTTAGVLIAELLFTLVLTLVWLAATEKTHAAGITGLGLGLGYAGVLFACLGTTWSALNPVRTLGPAVLSKVPFDMTTIGVLWIGTLVGAIVGAGIWTAVVMPARTSSPSGYTSEA